MPKNCEKIKELVNELKVLPDIICITETKLNSKNITNINISHYNFFHRDSPTNAGGVGMYLKDSLKYKIRNTFNLNRNQCEDTWIEFQSKTLNHTLSIIYRYSNSDQQAFQYKLENLVKLENSKCKYTINGDTNI